MNLASTYNKCDRYLAILGGWVQPILLLVIRIWWGWSFFLLGKGKLFDLGGTAGFFGGLGIPLPKFAAVLAGSAECLGGLLLLLGLCSRAASLVLALTMAVVYATASRSALNAIFINPDKFTEARAFLFLLAALLVFAFGPGRLSLDALFFKNTKAR